MSVSMSEVTQGQTVTVTWSANSLANCSGVTVKAMALNLHSTSSGGSTTLEPLPEDNGYAMYQLNAYRAGQVKGLDSAAVFVHPQTTMVYGRKTVYINTLWQTHAFVTAVGTPNTDVVLADGVNLNLSRREAIDVRAGVHIIGRRSSTNPGPRLYTTSRPDPLLVIGHEYPNTADGVRITGIRLDGGNMGIEPDDNVGATGIFIKSSANVEIGDNEIYGWSKSAVAVRDDVAEHLKRLTLGNASAVRIHDNYIHHNRHWRELGYGVVTYGAYALIERNVFDYNRHALAASHLPGTGYLAYNNLVLRGGGENCCEIVDSAVQHTHQFDVHGRDSCGLIPKGHYCGPAGEYFDYRYNTMLYTAGDGIKVRGFPSRGADVAHNVFAACGISGGTPISQTDGDNLRAHDNYICKRPLERSAVGDFDGDGWLDDFMSTGVTWWFRGYTGQWNHLQIRNIADWGSSEPDPPESLTFQDVNSDRRTDVRVVATGEVFSAGGPKRLVNGVPVAEVTTGLVSQTPLNGFTVHARVSTLNSQASGFTGHTTFAFGASTAAGTGVLGARDFNGDGHTDLLTRDQVGAVHVTLRDVNGAVLTPIGDRTTWQGSMPVSATFAGLGDFNADNRSDILWRTATGQLIIWFGGESGNSAKVTWLNVTDANGAPDDAPVGLDWQVKAIGDFDGDGYSDIYWKHTEGNVSIWHMKHAMHVADTYVGPVLAGWEVHGVGDFNGDGRADILWRHTDGLLDLMLQGTTSYYRSPSWQNRFQYATETAWQVVGVGDVNGDGRADILWRHTNGQVAVWYMNSGEFINENAQFPMDSNLHTVALLGKKTQTMDMR